MLEQEEEEQKEEKFEVISTRSNIHSEIEEVLINKLFRIVESIETDSDGNLNFRPYTDHTLLQIEAFLEKNFKQNVFKHSIDLHIEDFLTQVKKERERRDFGILLNR
ncbi:MAG: hypothetical protein FK730_13350 [Asgard group archaeon]|nr:hypothetical protein [Asgard group archaeon]